MEFLCDKARKPFLKHHWNTSLNWESNAGKAVIQHFLRRAFPGPAQSICHLSLSSNHLWKDSCLEVFRFPHSPFGWEQKLPKQPQKLCLQELGFGFTTDPLHSGRILKIILILWRTLKIILILWRILKIILIFFFSWCPGMCRPGCVTQGRALLPSTGPEEHFPLILENIPGYFMVLQELAGFCSFGIWWALFFWSILEWKLLSRSPPHTLAWWIYLHFPWKFPIPAFLYSLE